MTPGIAGWLVILVLRASLELAQRSVQNVGEIGPAVSEQLKDIGR